METDGRPEIKQLLNAASVALAIHGIRTILNPDTFPLIDEDFRNRAIVEATDLGWFQDGVLNAPPEIMSLLLRKNTP